jgi:hypothetical protein
LNYNRFLRVNDAFPPPHADDPAMIRSSLAVIAGVVLGAFAVWVIDLPSSYLHPLPPGVAPNDRDALIAHVGHAPLAAKVLVALAWTVGPMAGGWLAARIARRAYLVHGLIVGCIFLLMNAVTLIYVPLPLWLSAACLVLPPLSSCAGAYVRSVSWPATLNDP